MSVSWALALVCAAGAGADQSWVPGPGATEEKLKPGPGEITIDKAAEAARTLLRKLGVEVPSVVPEVSRTSYMGKLSSSVPLWYGSDLLVAVDLPCGTAWSYDDRVRQRAEPTNADVRGPLQMNEILAANNRAWGVMRDVGMPSDCKLVEFTCAGFGNGPGVSGPGVCPQVEFRFQPMPNGYLIHDNYGLYALVLDARDWGIIVYLNRGALNPPYVVESSACTLTLSQAHAIADPLAPKYGVGGYPVPGRQSHPPTKTNGLMLVHPNGEIGGLSYDKDENPARLRLAWVLYYDWNDEIWVDASAGKVLGGRRHSH